MNNDKKQELTEKIRQMERKIRTSQNFDEWMKYQQQVFIARMALVRFDKPEKTNKEVSLKRSKIKGNINISNIVIPTIWRDVLKGKKVTEKYLFFCVMECDNRLFGSKYAITDYNDTHIYFHNVKLKEVIFSSEVSMKLFFCVLKASFVLDFSSKKKDSLLDETIDFAYYGQATINLNEITSDSTSLLMIKFLKDESTQAGESQSQSFDSTSSGKTSYYTSLNSSLIPWSDGACSLYFKPNFGEKSDFFKGKFTVDKIKYNLLTFKNTHLEVYTNNILSSLPSYVVEILNVTFEEDNNKKILIIKDNLKESFKIECEFEDQNSKELFMKMAISLKSLVKELGGHILMPIQEKSYSELAYKLVRVQTSEYFKIIGEMFQTEA